ncbi:MAG: FadR/GntR family transcriptional regulator [Desulfobacterales bacterium]|nr:FadR/GntR family transcriptional regulator [Desulfobacteraceae bacterium]MDD3990923.1 FadR/GntR family transcriptional regulator [Desulfobacteraceae bacterium]MDY0312017.1 FadR/GntR family transcriptional regulator [Desulfobacterales bacterium]
MNNEAPPFREASRNRIFQDVVNQVQDAILEGRLKAGDVLPPERELKKMFNTSRGTLREALRVLEERGLLEIRLGMRGGAVVRTISSRQASESLALLVRSRKVALKHLAEFREGMEGNVASLATQRATAEDIQSLRALVEEAGRHMTEGRRDEFLDADKRFHLALSGITGNPVYNYVFHSIHDNIHRYYDQYLSMDGRELRENFQDLQDILRAVANRRPDEARVMAQSHVHRFHRYMEARQARDPHSDNLPGGTP